MVEALNSGSSNLEAMDAAPTYQAAMLKLMVSQMGLREGRVLDFGAGSGAYTRAAAAQTAWSMCALEPYEALHPLIGQGVEKYSSLDDVSQASLDGAFSLNVLEHIDDDVNALRTLSARCRPGAPIFLLVPAHMSLWSPMDDLVGHVRRYSMLRLTAGASAAGLVVERQGWFDTTGFFATHAYRMAVKAKLLAQTNGAVSKTQVGAFDRLFKVSEPVFAALRVPLGKNCWVLARTRA